MAEASNKLYQFIEQQKKELEKQVVSHGWVQGALVAKNKNLHKHNKHMLYFATEFSQPDRPHVTTTTTTKSTTAFLSYIKALTSLVPMFNIMLHTLEN